MSKTAEYMGYLGKFTVLLLLTIASVTYLYDTFTDEEHQYKEFLEVRAGIIEHDHSYEQLIVMTIDAGKTWLIVTPTREVVGYLHKKLPTVNPNGLQKVSLSDRDIFNTNNHKMYYDWL